MAAARSHGKDKTGQDGMEMGMGMESRKSGELARIR